MTELAPVEFHKALEALKQVKVNHYFARFVAEHQVTGTIYADHPLNPEVFYIVHPYGMSLLFGNPGNYQFNSWLHDYMINIPGKRSQAEWLQAYPDGWNSKIEELLGKNLVKKNEAEVATGIKQVEQHTRVNFKFDPGKFSRIKQTLTTCPYPIIQTTAFHFNTMKGSVVPRYFWDNDKDFMKKGMGFSVMKGDEPISLAYSAYIFDGVLELGIETLPDFRGKGIARHACVALIDYCLQHHYEPVWSCRLENTGSYLLAQKLGFEPVLTLPYYRLPV